jgi:hypothetical protein
MNDWGSCPNLYSISIKCFGIDANGGHEDDYVYYRNCNCGGVEMMPIDYLNRFYVLEK